jgi:hypothetical protein
VTKGFQTTAPFFLGQIFEGNNDEHTQGNLKSCMVDKKNPRGNARVVQKMPFPTLYRRNKVLVNPPKSAITLSPTSLQGRCCRLATSSGARIRVLLIFL